MKTQSMSNDTFRKGKSLFVTLPFPLLDYLSSDYALSRSRRYSKIEAFRFLVQQCCHSKSRHRKIRFVEAIRVAMDRLLGYRGRTS